MAAQQCIAKFDWETEIQWEGRREFITAHKHAIPHNKLEALSMVWANMKFMGCRYPTETESIIKDLESRHPVCTSDNIKRKQEEGRKKAIIEGFTLYVRDSQGAENAITLLHENAQRAKKDLEFQEIGYSNESKHFSCAVVLDNILLATGEGHTKKEAKYTCAENAIQILRKSQPVVDLLLTHEKAVKIEKGELTDKGKKGPPPIPESNLGSKMLRNMGWTGGGVGKEGKTGRVDPVMVNDIQSRQGLGHSSSNNTEVTKHSVKSTIQNFMTDHQKQDLRFSSDLSKEDRAIVHKICQQLGLKHKSFGTGQNRYLMISKR